MLEYLKNLKYYLMVKEFGMCVLKMGIYEPILMSLLNIEMYYVFFKNMHLIFSAARWISLF